MKKRLLVLLFVMVMALSVFSVTASAAPTISFVGVENLRFPLAGNTPDYNVSFTSSYLSAKENVNGYDLVNGIIWYRLDTPNTGSTPIEKKMDKNDVFELGKKYRVRIFVMPDNGASFANSAMTSRIYEQTSDVLQAKFKQATVTTPSGNTVTDYKVVYCDYVCEKAAIDSVEITGLKMPKAGEYPDDDCNVLTEGVYVNNLNSKVEWIYKGSIMNPATDKFVAGETYKLSIWLRTEFENGYYFQTDTLGENIAEVFINGIPFEVCDTYECDYVRGVEYEFYVPFNCISKVDIVGISYPIAGMEPDFEGAPTTDGYDIVNLFWLDETLKKELISGGMKYSEAVAKAKLVKGDGKVFEEGHEYQICITVKPQENYEIDYEIDGDLELLSYTATVNGKAASEGSGYRGENASFDCSFGTPIKQLIYNVDITGVDSPVAGNIPDYEVVCGADTYSVKNMLWIDVTKRDALISGGSTYVEAVKEAKLQKGDGKTFTAGHKYSVSFEVKPNKNYEIDYDPNDYYDVLYFAATVNGEDASEGSGNRGDNASFSYDFEHTCEYFLVKKLEPTCTETGKEAYYVCSCGKIGEDKTGRKLINDIASWGVLSAKGHTYKNVTTKATLSKNGKTENKCSVCGDVESSKTIYYPKTIVLSTTKYTYNGKTKTPSVTVKDSKGNTLKKDTDYTVKYESGRKLPGKYTVTVTFKGKYEGTKKLYFTIAPKATSKITATQTTSTITLKWSKVTGADGYRVYKYNSKTKKYEKLKDVTGTSLKISKLKAGTAYKYKVKAYTKDDGTIWGDYSK